MTMTAIKQTELLNGLPVAGLTEVARTVAEAPEQGILSFETRTRWLGGMRTRSEVRGFEMGGQYIARAHMIECDEPQEVFGNDEAPNPQELLLSAIGSCVSAIWTVQAAMAGIELRALEVHMRGTLDIRGSLDLAEVPPGFPELSCRVEVDADAKPEQLRQIHEAVQRLSPNFYHITHAIPTRAQLVIKS